MKKRTKIGLGILIVVFLLLSMVTGWPVISTYNNYLTTRFLNDLKEITSSDTVKVVNSYKHFGILSGNSNHCDSEVAVMIETGVAREHIDGFVRDLIALRSPFGNKTIGYFGIYRVQGQQLFYEAQGSTEKELTDEFDDYKRLKDLLTKVEQKGGLSYYIISVFDQTYTGLSMHDIRCH